MYIKTKNFLIAKGKGLISSLFTISLGLTIGEPVQANTIDNNLNLQEKKALNQTQNVITNKTFSDKLSEIISIVKKNDPSIKINLKKENKELDKTYFLTNYKEIKEKINIYSKAFKLNREFFILSKPISHSDNIDIFKITTDEEATTDVNKNNKENKEKQLEQESFISVKDINLNSEIDNKKIDISELFVYGCKTCSKMNDLVRLEKRMKEMDSSKSLISSISENETLSNFNHYLYPVAIKTESGRTIIADAMIYIALKDTLKKMNRYNEFEDLNSQLVFDTSYKKLNIDEPLMLFKWLKDKKIDVEIFKSFYYNKKNITIAKKLPDFYEKIELKTLPMIIVNNKFLMLKNVLGVDPRFYDEDILVGIFDYLYLLSELENHNLLTFVE